MGASHLSTTRPPSPQHSRPGAAMLTLDSTSSLPWLPSRESSPSPGRPPPLHLCYQAPLQRKEQFKYKSVLDANRASASFRAITGTESPGFRRVQTSRDRLRKPP